MGGFQTLMLLFLFLIKRKKIIGSSFGAGGIFSDLMA
jgi:hypothetical protein